MANRNNLKPVERSNRVQTQIAVARLRRFGDLAIATILLVVLAPLFLLVTIAIKWESPGPVFERRACIGRCGRFDKVEFRTTHYDPEKVTLTWTKQVSPVGEFLRFTRIDALPQILNILRGEMGLLDTDADLPSFLE